MKYFKLKLGDINDFDKSNFFVDLSFFCLLFILMKNKCNNLPKIKHEIERGKNVILISEGQKLRVSMRLKVDLKTHPDVLAPNDSVTETVPHLQ